MSDLKTSIILDLSGNLQNRARQYSSSVTRFGSKGSRSMNLLGRSISTASNKLDRMGNRYTALLTGAAGIGAIKQVGALEERFTRLGIQANRTEEDMDALKKKIFETALNSDIRVDPGQITSAIEQIIEKTGDLKYAEENIRNIGLAIQATGAEGADIGGIMAEFQKMGLTAKESFEALDILTVQGKEGAFTLENLASLGSRVVTAYTAMGRTGVTGIREMGAALQVIRQGTGSSEQAATSFEALLRVLGEADKVKALQQGGIQVFDADALKAGKEVLRPINEIMKELVEKTKGKKTIIQQILGDSEAVRVFNAAVSEFNLIGGVESLDRFYQLQADGSTITADSIRAAQTFNSALTNLYTVWRKFSDSQLTEPIKKLTEHLNSMEPGTIEKRLDLAKNVAIGLGSVWAANKLVRGGVGLSKLLKGGKASGLAGALGSGVVPVYVVNKQLSLLNKGTGFGAGAGAAAGTGAAAGAGSKALAYLGKAVLVAAAGAVGYGIGTLINTGIGKAMSSATEGRYSGSGALGDLLYDMNHPEELPESVKEKARKKKSVMVPGMTWPIAYNPVEEKTEVGGTIRLEIEGAPVTVKELSSTNPNVDIDVDSGPSMRNVY